MVKTCYVCKKFSVPGDCRSFHKFPNNNELKEKWMSAIGVLSVPKTATVCNDHFDQKCYHQTDGCNTLRRLLLPDAVPSITPNVKLLDNLHTLGKVDNEKPQSEEGIGNEKSPSNNSSYDLRISPLVKQLSLSESDDAQAENNDIHLYSTDIDEQFVHKQNENKSECSETRDELDCIVNENDSKSSHVLANSQQSNWTNQADENMIESSNSSGISVPKSLSDVSEISKKRKRLVSDTGNPPTVEKIRFMDGFMTKYVKREHFVSDAAWENFLRYKASRDAQSECSRKNKYKMQKKVNCFEELIRTLKEKDNSSAAEYLEGLPEHLKQIVVRIKEKKPNIAFPPQLKNFARTLHFHSPAAYEMIRQSFLKCLPCVETLNSWNCSKNYKPGICQEIIKHVSNMVQSSSKKGQNLIFNLTFDEINIKKWVFYCKNSKEWKGLVDVGGQLEDYDEKNEKQQASKALVFMLVNINGSFKTPVAYYMTNSLKGEEKCILLKDVLIELNKHSINVVSVTYDGDESNQRSCKILGANFDYTDTNNFKPYFQHPSTSENVYVFFDPCHMLKLVRNYFALKGPLFHKESKEINWNFI